MYATFMLPKWSLKSFYSSQNKREHTDGEKLFGKGKTKGEAE